MEEEILKSLFEAVSGKLNIGTYEKFVGKMQTKKDRKSFYDLVSSKGVNLGEYNKYEQRLTTPKTSQAPQETKIESQDTSNESQRQSIIDKYDQQAEEQIGSDPVISQKRDSLQSIYQQRFSQVEEGIAKEVDSYLQDKQDSLQQLLNAEQITEEQANKRFNEARLQKSTEYKQALEEQAKSFDSQYAKELNSLPEVNERIQKIEAERYKNLQETLSAFDQIEFDKSQKQAEEARKAGRKVAIDNLGYGHVLANDLVNAAFNKAKYGLPESVQQLNLMQASQNINRAKSILDATEGLDPERVVGSTKPRNRDSNSYRPQIGSEEWLNPEQYNESVRPSNPKLVGGGRTRKIPTTTVAEARAEAKEILKNWTGKMEGYISIINDLETKISKSGVKTDLLAVKSWDDFFQTASNIAGEQAVIMPLALLGGSMAMETAEAYYSQVSSLAKAHGITIQEVIEQGLDNPDAAISAGAISGSLDMLGTGKVVNALRKAVTGTVKKKLAEFGGTTVTEFLTELVQSLTLQTQNNLVSGEKINLRDALSEGLAGALMGGLLGSSVFLSNPEKTQIVKNVEKELEATTGDLGVQNSLDNSTDSTITEDNLNHERGQEPTTARAGEKITEPTKDQSEVVEKPLSKQVGSTFSEFGGSQEVGRIKPAPITRVKPKKLRQIQLDLKQGTKSNIFYTKSPSSRRSLGSYNPTNAAIAIKFDNDLDVTAHEIGHALDDRFGLLSKIPKDNLSQIKKELLPFSKYGSKPPKGHPEANQYILGEGVAEWIRAFVVNPEEAAKQAPLFHEWYTNTVPEKIRERIKVFSDDVRAFAGATGHESIMSNVQFDPEKTKSKLFKLFNRPDGFQVTYYDKLKANWANSLQVYDKAVKYLKGLNEVQELSPRQDPKMLARLYLGANEKLDNVLFNGLVDSNNKRLIDPISEKTMTLEWLIEPLDATTEKGLKNEVEEVASYMIAERTLELQDRFGKDLVSGIGGGIFTDKSIAQKRLEEHRNLPEPKQDRIEEAARRYREYADGVLRYMVEKGRMSKQTYSEIKQKNDYYVALNRVLEAAPGEEVVVYQNKAAKAVANGKEVVKKVKGSSKTIKNPYESLIESTQRALKEADRNEIMLAFRELFKTNRSMGDGAVVSTSEIARKATANDKNIIKIFVNGKPEYWQLQEDVFKAVKNLSEASFDLPPLITALPKMVRWTVTNFPVFALRNRIRDFQARFILSKNAEKGFDIYTKKGVKSASIDGYQLFGGGQAGYYLLDQNAYSKQLKKSIRELAKDKKTILLSPRRMASKYTDLLRSSEVSTRIEEYRSAFKKAKERGLDDYNASIYAASEARDLMDFAVSGYYLKVINQLVPFSNAAVQGLRKSIRTAQSDPKGLVIRIALYTLIPTMIERMFVSLTDSDDEYEQFPAWRKDLFYNFKISSNLWVSIPKPFELGMVGSAAGRAIDHSKGQDDAFEGYAGSLSRSLLPVDESAIAGFSKGIIEGMANKDFYRDRPIIPRYEEDLSIEKRNTQTASRLGNAIQHTFGYINVPVDGRIADHIIESTFTYFGRFGLKLSDIGREDSHHEFGLPDTGLMANSPVYNAKDVQWVIEFARKNGHSQKPYYKALQQMIGTYFDEKDEKIKKPLGNSIIEYSKKIRNSFEP